MKEKIINEIIRSRKSIYPSQYNGEKIPERIIKDILENANTAPNHKLTYPWRFHVFSGDKKNILAQEIIKLNHDTINNNKKKRIKDKITTSSHVICICMQRDQEKRVPEWEEIAATSMAVQNMWLTCTANNIGCYWSSPEYIKRMNIFLELEEGQRCLGFLYLGMYNILPDIKVRKKDISENIIWHI